MKRFPFIVLSALFGLTLGAVPSASLIAEEGEGHACPHGCVAGKFEMMTLTGTHHCSACDLKKELGVAVDCAQFGHRWGIKITKAVDYCGNEKAEWHGKTFIYLPNQSSAELAKLESGKTVTLLGKLFFDSPMFEVEKISPSGS